MTEYNEKILSQHFNKNQVEIIKCDISHLSDNETSEQFKDKLLFALDNTLKFISSYGLAKIEGNDIFLRFGKDGEVEITQSLVSDEKYDEDGFVCEKCGQPYLKNEQCTLHDKLEMCKYCCDQCNEERWEDI